MVYLAPVFLLFWVSFFFFLPPPPLRIIISIVFKITLVFQDQLIWGVWWVSYLGNNEAQSTNGIALTANRMGPAWNFPHCLSCSHYMRNHSFRRMKYINLCRLWFGCYRTLSFPKTKASSIVLYKRIWIYRLKLYEVSGKYIIENIILH